MTVPETADHIAGILLLNALPNAQPMNPTGAAPNATKIGTILPKLGPQARIVMMRGV